MKKALTILLAIAFVSAGLAAQETKTAEKKEKTAAAKEFRWSGYIVRTSKDDSTITVKKGNAEKIVVFDNSTQWTEKSKPAEASLFIEGASVICFGKYDEKGRLIARRIDLRTRK